MVELSYLSCHSRIAAFQNTQNLVQCGIRCTDLTVSLIERHSSLKFTKVTERPMIANQIKK